MEERSDEQVEAAIATGVVPVPLQIRLTEGALAEARKLAADPERAGHALRSYIDGKGCDGFFYGVAFDTRGERDMAYEQDGLPMLVDPESLRFMYGSSVSWVDDERGRGFLVENPNHRRFRGKFFKKAAWKDKLTGPSPASAAQ